MQQGSFGFFCLIDLKIKAKENKKKADKTENFCELGEDKNERQMVNNVNCKEMRFVIRNMIDVDDVSPATAQDAMTTLTADADE